MFFPEGRIRAFVYGEAVDMRKSFTGLYALTRHALGQNPLSGDLYVFINRRGNYLKCLYWDRSGFCLWAKRLERECFVGKQRRRGVLELDWTGLKLLLEGIEPGRRRVRYRERKTTPEQSLRV